MMPAAQAVEALIQEYGRLVFHTIYALTNDWEESQDLTQDTFQQALRGIDAARSASESRFNARAWLLQIALNTVRMQQRRRRLFRFVPFSRLASATSSEVPEQSEEATAERLNAQALPVQPAGYGATASVDPGELIAERDAVQQTLRKLPETLRVCLLLSIVGDFSTAEIAQMLNLKEAAVRQRLVRARKQFQQIYTQEGHEVLGDHQGPANAQTPPSLSSPNYSHEGRVESRSTQTHWKRFYAERLYRDPAPTPLW